MRKPNALIPPVGRTQLSPLNTEQVEYLSALQTCDQVFCIGPAGTGKTYVPTAHAADLLISKSIRTLRLCRPAVSAGGEKLGFLPGELEQKLAPWVVPFTDILEERLGKTNAHQLIFDGRVMTESFEHMRGRTWNDSYVILDEAQNTTPEQMKLFLTRVGYNSKVVVTGDVRQTDIRGLNGLDYVLDLIEDCDLDVAVIKLQKVERSEICAMWTDAFEKNPA